MLSNKKQEQKENLVFFKQLCEESQVEEHLIIDVLSLPTSNLTTIQIAKYESFKQLLALDPKAVIFRKLANGQSEETYLWYIISDKIIKERAIYFLHVKEKKNNKKSNFR